jgi:hypothetical protein
MGGALQCDYVGGRAMGDAMPLLQALLVYEEDISGSTEQVQAITIMIGVIRCSMEGHACSPSQAML